MSIRTAIALAILVAVLLTSTLVAALGISRIRRSMDRTTRDNVDRSLAMFQNVFADRGQRVAHHVHDAAEALRFQDPGLAALIDQRRQASGLLVLNVCDADGRPLGRKSPTADGRVPLPDDPVIRRALTGLESGGVVFLSEDRLTFEGGAALRNATAIPGASPEASHPGALFWWAAVPLFDGDGTVKGVVYGGDTINLNYALVDELRDLVFPRETYGGKPLGTVTVFAKDTRAATNVLLNDQRRAVGTVVSDEVRNAVLERGETWRDRAWVVDAWYLSAYAPLRDPDGTPIGMLYVGLLEAPYRDAVRELALEFAVIVVGGALLTILLASLLVVRITTPVEHLGEVTTRMAEGELDFPLKEHPSYREIDQLTHNFRLMQDTVHRRDRELNKNNEALARANKNYMTTLGFVTHELKSPLAAMQSIIDVVVGGYLGKVPESIEEQLVRVKHNCEEMQDMVKNYLDLARAERGELEATMADLDYRAAVLEPAIDQSQALFDSREMTLEVICPERVPIRGDEELLRIALSNYLNNAAKYGRKNGRARVEVSLGEGELTVTVWNEGEGFLPEEGGELFGKFARLKNGLTASKRGSGLGLYLCRQIVELHGGRVWAESEPGVGATFGQAIPRG